MGKEFNEREKEFVVELKALMGKFGVSLFSDDNYDGNESYCGTEYGFVGGIQTLEIDIDLDVLIEELQCMNKPLAKPDEKETKVETLRIRVQPGEEPSAEAVGALANWLRNAVETLTDEEE
jgi:hypothetical protein